MKGLIIFMVFLLGILCLVGSGCSVYNGTNAKFQAAEAGQSQYGSALDICSQKIKGVWTIMSQHFEHESGTQTGVAQARSGYLAAVKSFEAAAAQGVSLSEMTKHAGGALEAALAFQVQVESYPQLQGGQVAQENMRNMQEGTNEIKTALDDWIRDIEAYNRHRGNAWPNILNNITGMLSKWPDEIEYYKGKTRELDMDALNPQNSG